MSVYELNIHNYTYNDILTLFKLAPNYTELNSNTTNKIKYYIY
jgi:hypothetical protein